LDIKKLFLVDPYLEYDEFKDNIGWTQRTQLNFEDFFRIATMKLEPYKDKIEFIRKKSEEAADSIPDDLDFVYIDGNHDYEYVKRDCEIYYPKLKHGGVLGGDNFESLFPCVIRAVTEFADRHNLEIHGARWAESYEWWVIKE
jgi:predicted O-methyltransferase YrrM